MTMIQPLILEPGKLYEVDSDSYLIRAVDNLPLALLFSLMERLERLLSKEFSQFTFHEVGYTPPGSIAFARSFSEFIQENSKYNSHTILSHPCFSSFMVSPRNFPNWVHFPTEDKFFVLDSVSVSHLVNGNLSQDLDSEILGFICEVFRVYIPTYLHENLFGTRVNRFKADLLASGKLWSGIQNSKSKIYKTIFGTSPKWIHLDPEEETMAFSLVTKEGMRR